MDQVPRTCAGAPRRKAAGLARPQKHPAHGALHRSGDQRQKPLNRCGVRYNPPIRRGTGGGTQGRPPMALHRLSSLKVKIARPGRFYDGAGLYLYVSLNPNSGELRKSWVYRFQSNGRAREMGLGSLNDVSLQEARKRAAAARKLHKVGQDPIEARKAARTAKQLEPAKVMTFDQCAEVYIAAHIAGWQSVRHIVQWTETLKTYASPVIGSVPVQQIDVSLIIKVLQPIWTSKPVTASRVRQRIKSVLDWATASGFRQGDNPARWQGHLENLLPPISKIREVKHLTALPYAEVAALLADLRKRPGLAARALQFTILTAASPGEVLGARWSEIDFDQRGWTVPAERSKAHRERRVPLSPRALEILKGVPRRGDKIFKLTHTAMWELVHSNLSVHEFRSTIGVRSEQTSPGK
jgi:integrase-like protein/Arm domain-containing DNA-binding protein